MAESQNVAVITDANFQSEIQEGNGLAMVDFWAEWCGPCRIIAPFVDQLADEYAGRVTVGKLDVDANQQTAAQFGVRSIPTILFFKDGRMVDQVVGAVPKAALDRKIQEHLAA
jgi:thioredoxin 1